MTLRGVIYDLDGTLADTLPVCCAAFRHALRPHVGRDLTDAEIQGLFGPTEEGIFQRLAADQWQSALRTYLARYAELHRAPETAIPGIAAVLQMQHERRVPAGVVTGKGPLSTQISLEALGLSGYIGVVEPGSPHGPSKPESLRRVLERWGFPPRQVAYVGDSPYDMRSARESGLQAVAAAWTASAPLAALQAEEPDALFQTVTDFREWLAVKLTDGTPADRPAAWEDRGASSRGAG